MTSQEAHAQIKAALDKLISVRDALGEQLSAPGVDLLAPDGETRRISDLHDRVARAIQAYN